MEAFSSLFFFFFFFPLIATFSTGSAQKEPTFACDVDKVPAYRNFTFCDGSLDVKTRVDDLLKRLSLREKISFLVTEASSVTRLGIPKYQWWSEGLHGVDLIKLPGYTSLVPGSTSFPAPILTAASFNVTLFHSIAKAAAPVFSGEAVRRLHDYSGGPSTRRWWLLNPAAADPQRGLTARERRRFSSNQRRRLRTATIQDLLSMAAATPPSGGGSFCRYSCVRRSIANRGRDLGARRRKHTAATSAIFLAPVQDPAANSTATGKSATRVTTNGPGLQIKPKPPQTQHDDGDNNGKLKIAGCCKHYTAYDLDNWNGISRYTFNAVLPPDMIYEVTKQDMEDTFQPPFESCVRDAKAASVMCSYNQVNGKPICGDPDLLAGVVRGKWNLNGYIVTDCDSLYKIFNDQHYTKTPEETVALGLKAGVDINCDFFWLTTLKLQSTKDLPKDVCSQNNQDLAEEAARQGIVLLKNSPGSLPLLATSIKSLGVIGPNANATKSMLGDYAGIPCRYTSPLQGLTRFVPTVYTPGCKDVYCETPSINEAKKITSSVDAVVLIMGSDFLIENEGLDRINITLPGKQSTLVSEVSKVSKGPVILVILSGGGMDVSFAIDNPAITSILWAGFPGESGGIAIAEVIFGSHNPSGKLPVTWYPQSYVEGVPMTDMRMRPDPMSRYPGRPGRTYRFYKGPTVFDFGHGLSYTNFTHTIVFGPPVTIHLCPKENHSCNAFECDPIAVHDSSFYLHVKIKNAGERVSLIDTIRIIGAFIMSSEVITSADFWDFQQQIDRQLLAHTTTMQTLKHIMEQLQHNFGELFSRLEKTPAAGFTLPRTGGGSGSDPVPLMSKLKLEMPKTDGTDPLGWLFKAHEYFVFYGVTEDARLPVVSLMLEGPALDWFRWRQRNALVSSWSDFLSQFKLRFNPLSYVDYFGLLSKVHQTGSVLEYQQAFKKILVNVTRVAEPNLQSLFHAGLKSHLQHEIMLLKPSSLSASFALARELEVKYTAWTSAMPPRREGFRDQAGYKTQTPPPNMPLLPSPVATLLVHSATLRTCLARKFKNDSGFSKEYFTQENSSYVPILEELAQNKRFLNAGFPKPWAIITPKDKYEVQAIILCAKRHGIQIRIRSGGHVYEGDNNGTAVSNSFKGLCLGRGDKVFAIIQEEFPELELERKNSIEMSWIELVVHFAGFPIGTPLDHALLTSVITDSSTPYALCISS
ncbi:unnamed protein product [Cuscuta campestris]|uniref:FAD-binding PCMH-type domain-containing protein n=1 Tax=Cuscuta campestris TaxID=132261 RepID=A0A484MR98_9ASTE|nr:unnamed protein product [Cuscuta campestris]